MPRDRTVGTESDAMDYDTVADVVNNEHGNVQHDDDDEADDYDDDSDPYYDAEDSDGDSYW